MDRHIGEWKSSSENTELILDESNHATWVVDNRVTGGDEFIIKGGYKAELKYKIDYTKNPIWLDIIKIVHGEDGQIDERCFKGIVKFLTDKKIEYNINIKTDIRPDGFDKGKILILDKQN